MFIIGKPCSCNVFRPRATWGAGPRAHSNVTTCTNFWQNLKFRLPGCIIWFSTMHASSSIIMMVSGQFFFLLRPLQINLINWCIGCLLALYGSTLHPARLCGYFWTIIFFSCLGVWSPYYALSRKELIHGGIGSTWEHNFYMGTQNGSKNEISHEKFLIHALELKLWPLKFIHMFI